MNKLCLVLIITPLLTSTALAAGPSMERGKELFNSSELGTNGKSCATCHRDGKKLKQAASYAEGELGEIINQCIKNPLEGKRLDPSSSDMKSLIIYIKAFAGPGKL
jgi:cytochrome c